MQKLSELISTMKLPVQRKEHFSKHNLMWLARNIGVKNSNHKNYETAVDEIKRRLKEACAGHNRLLKNGVQKHLVLNNLGCRNVLVYI